MSKVDCVTNFWAVFLLQELTALAARPSPSLLLLPRKPKLVTWRTTN